MKRLTRILLPALFAVLAFTACDDDDTTVNPIETGANVSVRNTFESAVFSAYPGFEIYANEADFGEPASGTVGTEIEFNKFLGLYDIDLSNNSITYKLVDVAPEGIMFRTIEEGTFDRYYFTFNKAQAFTSATVDDEFVKVSVLSNTELKVEIGAGYDFTSGHTFEITLK